VIGLIGNARRMKLLGASWDTYALVVTARRIIFAQITAGMLNTAYKDASEKAKSENGGYVGQIMHQMSVAFQFCKRYENMVPDQVLAESAGNGAVENFRISAIDLKLVQTGQSGWEYHEFNMIIQSAEGTFAFMIGEDNRFISLLRNVYGDKVHMPPGYFRAGGTKITLFNRNVF
jgi:hypothetical protein